LSLPLYLKYPLGTVLPSLSQSNVTEGLLTLLGRLVGAPELPPRNASFADNADKIGTHEGRAFITMGSGRSLVKDGSTARTIDNFKYQSCDQPEGWPGL
jgi:hypothetical protein